MAFWDGVEEKIDKNYGGGYPVYMQLENNKIVLLGFLQYDNKFKSCDMS